MDTKEAYVSPILKEIEKNNIYVENGFDDRNAYMEYLADLNGIPVSYVWDIANVLGQEEDFDALVTTLDDYAPTFTNIEDMEDEDYE